MAYFVDRVDGGRIQVSQHPGKTLQIGRGTNVEVRLDDPAVSLIHAIIEQQATNYVLTDQGTALGTVVNGEPKARCVLQNGDTIAIGTFEIIVEILGGDQPLFLNITRIGEEDASFSGTMTVGTLQSSSKELLGTFTETLMLRTATMGTGGAHSGTMRTTGSQSLLAMAEAYAESHDLPMADSGVADLRDIVDEAASSTMAPPPPPVKPLPAVDYAGAYRLERGFLLRKRTASLLFTVLALGSLAALVAGGVQDVFSPGELASVHKSVTANNCDSCHRPFRQIDEIGCLSSRCHATIGVHQMSQVVDPSCLECHLEHSTLDALRQLNEASGCIPCHERLGAQTVGKPSFVATITNFNAEQHPPFTPREDPGNLRFNHAWHLDKLKKIPGQTALTCESCHNRDIEGEIELVSFEKHCQRCHNLAFDARFGSQQAEHDTPAKMLNDMTGFYLQNRGVLRRLTYEEQDRLRGRSLSVEDQLAVVAAWNALSLVRNKCRICHDFDGRPGRGPLQDLNVEPTALRFGWYDHAVFKHGPHLGLQTADGTPVLACRACHPGARASEGRIRRAVGPD